MQWLSGLVSDLTEIKQIRDQTGGKLSRGRTGLNTLRAGQV